tara:strand:- start:546 stop:1019 length:474 start_codon:yes stop_codon:yes gene_type:complete
MKLEVLKIKVFMTLLLITSLSYSDVINVEGDIDSDVTWTSENTYFLNNQAFVKSGATLTIEAGTVIVGRYDANLAYNSFSKRLIRISNEVAGHFWERPFHSLNFVANKKWGNIKYSFKVTNLLGDNVRIAHYYKDEYYDTQNYNPGRNVSIGIQYNN